MSSMGKRITRTVGLIIKIDQAVTGLVGDENRDEGIERRYARAHIFQEVFERWRAAL